MIRAYKKIILVAFSMFVFVSISGTGNIVYGEEVSFQPLRVGITPNNPPLIFRQGGQIAGVEADLARQLGKALNRPIQFIELSWDQQISALLNGETDIIMSGMSITDARKVRIDFTDVYLKSGLVASFRAEDIPKYTSVQSVLESFATVGMIEGTTGDAFVKRNVPKAVRISRLTTPKDAASELKRRSIDIFIHDAPSIIWLVSENEADLAALWEPLNEESLAWGVKKGNGLFLEKVNRILGDWKSDGTLNTVLLRWLPAKYLERFR